jgi:hypothetical protein
MDLEPFASRFFLNPYPSERFKQCPSCGDPTYPRNRTLLVQIASDTVMPVSTTCEYCSNCDLLIAHRREIETELNDISDAEVEFGVDAPILVLGMLDRTRLRQDPMDLFDPDELLEAFRPAGRYLHYVRGEDAEGNPIWIEQDAPEGNTLDVPVPEVAEVRFLDQDEETWEVGVRQLHAWVMEEVDEAPFRPYITMVVSRSGPVVVFSDMTVGEPTSDELRDTVLKAMAHPVGGAGNPRRPTHVVTDDTALAEPLRELLDSFDIDCSVGVVADVDDALVNLEEFLGHAEDTPGLLAHPDVTPDQVGDLYYAAAEFYMEAMWEWLFEEDLIAIRYPTPDGPWRFVSVIGNAGWEFGIAVWENIADYTFAATMEPEDAVGKMEYHALTFEEMHDLPPADVADQKHHGWPVADPWSYPFPMVATHDGRMLRPGPEEIEWYTAALQALVEFADEMWDEAETEEVSLDPVAMFVTVLIGDDEVDVELRFPAEMVLQTE